MLSNAIQRRKKAGNPFSLAAAVGTEACEFGVSGSGVLARGCAKKTSHYKTFDEFSRPPPSQVEEPLMSSEEDRGVTGEDSEDTGRHSAQGHPGRGPNTKDRPPEAVRVREH